MQDRSFFERALSAAKESPEQFKSEFKKPDANANAVQYHNGWTGDRLIYSLIREIPDEDLPNILNILVEHNVDLKSPGLHEPSPLNQAVICGKKKATDFLLKYKYYIEDDPDDPAIIRAIHSKYSNKIDIVKALLDSGYKIDIQNARGFSPLMEAVNTANPKLVVFLLANKADLSLKKYWGSHDRTLTALGIAYVKYTESRLLAQDDLSNRKYCFEILLHRVAYKILELDPLAVEDTSILEKHLVNLAGNCKVSLDLIHKENIVTLLKEPLLILMKKIQKAQYLAFLSGSRKPSAIYQFFNKNDGFNLSRLIFTFVNGKKLLEAKKEIAVEYKSQDKFFSNKTNRQIHIYLKKKGLFKTNDKLRRESFKNACFEDRRHYREFAENVLLHKKR